MDERVIAEMIGKSAEHVLAEIEDRLATVPHVARVAQEIAAVRSEVAEIARDLRAHIEREEAAISNAFPGGDLAAHRMAHEQMMEALREETKFWRELRLDLAKKGIWGLAVIVVGLALVGITFKLGLAR